MAKDDLTVRNLAKRYVEWVTKPRENPFPKVVQPAVAKATEVMSYRPPPRNAEQDRQIEENKRAIEIAKKYAESQQAPRDGGEIDQPAQDPGMRQPVQMQREFSNDQDKEEYLQRIRDAQRNASVGTKQPQPGRPVRE